MDAIQRRELKFMINRTDVLTMQSEFQCLLHPDAYANDRLYSVRSLYFDSLNQMDYTDKMNGEDVRKKIRLRIYDVHQDNAKFECKQKIGAHQKKLSLLVSKADALQYIGGDYHSLLTYPEDFAKHLYSVLTLGAYRPAAIIDYQRRAYMFPAYNTRVTFDENIRRCEFSYDLYSETLPLYPVLSDNVILEIKYNGVLLDECEDDAVYQILTKYVDMDSLASAYLLDQLSNEVDQNYLSTFYYFDGVDGKLYAGPAWDYDRSFGNDALVGTARTRYVEFNSFPNGFPEQLSKNESFMELVRQKLEEMEDVISGLSTSISARTLEISCSLDMDSILWNNVYQENVTYLEWYINERVTLVRDIIENPDKYHQVCIGNTRTGRVYWARDGKTLSSSVISSICSLYQCTSLVTEGGVTMWDGYPIFSDLVLSVVGSTTTAAATTTATDTETAVQQTTTVEGTTSSSTDRKEVLGMNILIFIIFVAPGLITMYLTGELKNITKSNAGLRVGQYVIYEFLTFLFTYGVITILKGEVTLSLSLEYASARYTIFCTNVVFEVMAAELLGASIIGMGIVWYRKRHGSE